MKKLFVFLMLLTASLRCEPISKTDQAKLEILWCYLIAETEVPYTFFSTKPMSSFGFDLPGKNLWLSTIYQCSYSILSQSWGTWKKYQHQFPLKDICFIEERGSETLCVTVLNKPLCLQVIESNLDLFREVLGQDVCPEELLEKMQEVGISKTLGQSQALYGILLGFGRENAITFSNIHVKGWHFLDIEPFDNEGTGNFQTIRLPSFITLRNDPETKRLRKEYQATRKEISKDYEHGNYFQTTMKKISVL